MTLSIIPYAPLHEAAVRELVENHHRVHLHLDWHPLSSSLGISGTPSLLAYNIEQKLVGAIIFTPPAGQSVWIRLLAIHDDVPTKLIATLLTQAEQYAKIQHLQYVLCLETAPWVGNYLLAHGYRLHDHIIHMRRYRTHTSEQIIEPNPQIHLRAATADDVPHILAIDHSAFEIPWQMKYDDLQVTVPQSVDFSVAMIGQQIVGYEISTLHYGNIHLTRLATHPAVQGQGVASTILLHLLNKFPEHGFTVNTQQSNTRSRHLYSRFGFRLLKFRTPVWQRKVEQ